MHTTTETEASGTGAMPGAAIKGPAEVAQRANLDALWQRREAAEEDSPSADELDDLIADAETAILKAPVRNDRDALAVAIVAVFLSAPGLILDDCLSAGEIGMFALLRHLASQATAATPASDPLAQAVAKNDPLSACEGDQIAMLGHLARRAGAGAATFGLGRYWAEIHGAPERRASTAARKAREQTRPKPTLRAQLDALRSAVPEGALMAVHVGTWVDFYDEDARFVSDALGIVLNQRRDGEGGTIALCGVPAFDFDRRRPALESSGRRVAVVDATAAQRA